MNAAKPKVCNPRKEVMRANRESVLVCDSGASRRRVTGMGGEDPPTKGPVEA